MVDYTCIIEILTFCDEGVCRYLPIVDIYPVHCRTPKSEVYLDAL